MTSNSPKFGAEDREFLRDYLIHHLCGVHDCKMCKEKCRLTICPVVALRKVMHIERDYSEIQEADSETLLFIIYVIQNLYSGYCHGKPCLTCAWSEKLGASNHTCIFWKIENMHTGEEFE